MTEHHDTLEQLNQHIPLQEKIIAAHKKMSELFPFIVRVAVAIYDPKTTMLKTFIHSSDETNPLENYQALIDDVPSLKALLKKGLPRVVNNLVTFNDSEHEHTKRIGRQGFAASYTLPMFNANKKDVFTESVLHQVDIYGHIISLTVLNELNAINTLSAAVKTTGSITHVRDPETGSHLDRMSRYSRLIASELAVKYNLNDSYIEHIFMFSPLHDIGKIGIPDKILLKPGKLDEDEKSIMQTHTSKGRKMIDEIISNFGLQDIEHKEILRNIAEFHHEAINGKGYPTGIKGTEIQKNLLNIKNYPGVTGKITFDINGDVVKPLRFYVVKGEKFIVYE